MRIMVLDEYYIMLINGRSCSASLTRFCTHCAQPRPYREPDDTDNRGARPAPLRVDFGHSILNSTIQRRITATSLRVVS